jgi:hypothetical protein
MRSIIADIDATMWTSGAGTSDGVVDMISGCMYDVD